MKLFLLTRKDIQNATWYDTIKAVVAAEDFLQAIDAVTEGTDKSTWNEHNVTVQEIGIATVATSPYVYLIESIPGI